MVWLSLWWWKLVGGPLLLAAASQLSKHTAGAPMVLKVPHVPGRISSGEAPPRSQLLPRIRGGKPPGAASCDVDQVQFRAVTAVTERER